MGAGGATARWLYSARLAQRNRRRYPDRYLIVRYETLVQQPQSTLEAICAFLGETYVPAMLTMDAAPTYREKGADITEPHGSPITTAYVGRYRTGVPPRDVKFIQTYARRTMRAFGYEPDPIKLTMRELIAFACVDQPSNLGRMLAWRAIEAVQHAFPGYAGRKPSAAMIKAHA
jgi:hypothetical protein